MLPSFGHLFWKSGLNVKYCPSFGHLFWKKWSQNQKLPSFGHLFWKKWSQSQILPSFGHLFWKKLVSKSNATLFWTFVLKNWPQSTALLWTFLDSKLLLCFLLLCLWRKVFGLQSQRYQLTALYATIPSSSTPSVLCFVYFIFPPE